MNYIPWGPDRVWCGVPWKISHCVGGLEMNESIMKQEENQYLITNWDTYHWRYWRRGGFAISFGNVCHCTPPVGFVASPEYIGHAASVWKKSIRETSAKFFPDLVHRIFCASADNPDSTLHTSQTPDPWIQILRHDSAHFQWRLFFVWPTYTRG